MNIKINGHTFNNVNWTVSDSVGVMRFASNDSIIEIVNNIGENSNIEVYNDSDVLISIWYNSGIKNVYEFSEHDGTRYVEVSFVVSILDSNMEEILQGGIEESVDGIIELAEYISEVETEQNETRRRIDVFTKSVQDVANSFDVKQTDTNAKFVQKDAQIQDIVTEVNSIRDALTAAQSAISDIPKDIVQRFDALWVNYNDLADRVARLENGEG